MIFQGIIFDLDGVICSTDEYHYQAWKELADREGIPFDRSVNNRLRGVSRMESLEILLERAKRFYSQEEKEKMAAAKNTRYQELLREMTPADLSPEVFETLETLRKQGLKLAIGSSSKNTPLILDRLGLGGYFDAVSDGNNITRSKPAPRGVFESGRVSGAVSGNLPSCGGRRVRCGGRPPGRNESRSPGGCCQDWGGEGKLPSFSALMTL